MIIGFTNGCFDLLHKGHVHLLTEARKHCDRLIVGVNSDASVRRLKGAGRPLWKEQARLNAVRPYASLALIFEGDTPAELLAQFKPQVIIKGDDYTVEQVVGHENARVVLVPRLPGISTTAIINRRRGT